MGDLELVHNPLNGVTAGVWRRGDVVHKVLTRRREAPAHWAASDDPRHWNYWKREALVYRTGLPQRLGLGAPDLLGDAESPEGTSSFASSTCGERTAPRSASRTWRPPRGCSGARRGLPSCPPTTGSAAASCGPTAARGSWAGRSSTTTPPGRSR